MYVAPSAVSDAPRSAVQQAMIAVRLGAGGRAICRNVLQRAPRRTLATVTTVSAAWTVFRHGE